MSRQFGYVLSHKDGERSDTARVLKFVKSLVGFTVVAYATDFTKKAEEAEKGGFFEGRKKTGLPLVVVIENGKVIWAACAPTQGELYEALHVLSSTASDEDLLAVLGNAPDTLIVDQGEGEGLPLEVAQALSKNEEL